MVRPDCHLLVYEFMKNGSLQGILNDVSQGRRELEWLARHRISRGIASGLEYLHMYHRPRIIHRDIKPGNALIDDDMEDRISDFGLAKVLPDGHTQIRASNTDFGVAELPSDDFFQHTEEMSLVKWMRNVMNSANPNRAIDSKLLGNGYEEQMLLVLKIAYFCTMDDPKQRPNSRDVRCMLSQIQH
ncbi:leucine-rich repeat receptor-like serine/threonine/tyrosine-protein kinase SOBIR1 [Citrus sinensis]|uniref:Leucine-rich repeat receptor-like serine/threonine/tyrosine-protein kinase SOBIR1 n=1 Tax=Citrus sinensis TaxID=2711 RepID=A0ACB8MC59_CITSI|nr:leucine-rich repeat receptor-like serine/threonine/tyrosine-protein kinase SOBIR1 [Citrus sinensis]